ncbi:PREDICTED: uncharacterized protein LOC109587927 [Amphimedon queenslandica]|nr:PREDICTED: uncharacterized protein LOC109587927 [Amphimedon queenslandica]|eukprot:XP_019859695.1 PREDICTED: uncharacterized protein LOC109587927 [Amphimedon queenslandica]
MNDITGLISIPLNHQCIISIVLSNEAGSSEPFILSINAYHLSSPNITNVTTIDTTTTQTFPTTTAISRSFSISTVIVLTTSSGVVIILLLLIIMTLIVFVILNKRKLNRFASLQQQQVPTAHNEAYEFNTLMINANPAYEEIRGNRGGAVNI